MLFTTSIFALCGLGAVSAAASHIADICKENGSGPPWTCRTLKECKSAQNSLRSGIRPEVCGFEGADPLVCCEPSLSRPVRASSKSKEMCKKYAEHVFLKANNPLDGGDIRIDTCAVVEPHITNGVNADPREYPHMALIGYGEKTYIQWLCGGSLISDQFVLGAAHCSSPPGEVARWVKLGEYDLKSKKEALPQPVVYEIVERIVHPEYKATILYNDIALYKLNTKVDFNEFIRPACLQTEHGFHQSYAIATGWGRTEYGGKQSDILQKVNITILPTVQCDEAYKSAISTKLKNGIIRDQMICAGDIDNGKDTCAGDAGGPLQIRLEEPYCMYSVIGITSFGLRCAEKPSVYTRVSHYVPWIESVVWP